MDIESSTLNSPFVFTKTHKNEKNMVQLNQQSFVSVSHEPMIPSLSQSEPLYQPSIELTSLVKTTMETDKQSISFVGQIQISDSSYTLRFSLNENVQNQKHSEIEVNISYSNTETIGTNGNFLLIFINSNKNNVDQNEDEQQNDNVADEVISLIKQQKQGNFYLRGQCTITIEFQTLQTKQKAYQLLSLYVGEEDEGASQYENDEEMQEMIRADDIDEDGNIIVKDHESNQEEDEQEENEMEDQYGE